jgi:hypothetical protein
MLTRNVAGSQNDVSEIDERFQNQSLTAAAAAHSVLEVQ